MYSSTNMKRTSSMCSLPSPPIDHHHLHQDEDEEMQVAQDGGPYQAIKPTRLPHPPKRPYMVIDQEEEDSEVDQLAEEEEEEVPSSHSKPLPRLQARPSLGSPVNVSGGIGGGGSISRLASRKQLLNPFFHNTNTNNDNPPLIENPSSSTFLPLDSSSSLSIARSTSSTTSPVRNHHHQRRRVDPDRIKLNQRRFDKTPPQKTRQELELERIRVEGDEIKERKRREMAWDDPENPFLDKDDAMAKRLREKESIKRPETLTYVKRGERIRTSIPFTAVLTSSSPSEDPFTYTTPRLLFPPSTPKPPSTPPSSFLEALRATATAPPVPLPPSNVNAVVQEKGDAAASSRDELPPTPVTLKRKAPTRSNIAAGGGGSGLHQHGYKKMKLPSSEQEHQQRGLR